VNEPKSYKARISKIVLDKGYVVTHSQEISGTITFSINQSDQVWKEDEIPLVGSQVILTDLRKMDGGWRAFHARYYRPEDE